MEYSNYIETRDAAILDGSELVAGSQSGSAKRWTTQQIADLATGVAVDRATVSTSASPITLNFQGEVYRIFVGSASFAAPRTIAYSENTNALKYEVLFEITDVAAVLTFPSNSIVWSIAGVYENVGKTWTANDIGKFKIEASYDGTNWWIKIFGYFS